MAVLDDDRLLRPAGTAISGRDRAGADGHSELTARKLHVMSSLRAGRSAAVPANSSMTMVPAVGPPTRSFVLSQRRMPAAFAQCGLMVAGFGAHLSAENPVRPGGVADDHREEE